MASTGAALCNAFLMGVETCLILRRDIDSFVSRLSRRYPRGATVYVAHPTRPNSSTSLRMTTDQMPPTRFAAESNGRLLQRVEKSVRAAKINNPTHNERR